MGYIPYYSHIITKEETGMNQKHIERIRKYSHIITKEEAGVNQKHIERIRKK